MYLKHFQLQLTYVEVSAPRSDNVFDSLNQGILRNNENFT